jgi:hypothetical protein
MLKRYLQISGLLALCCLFLSGSVEAADARKSSTPSKPPTYIVVGDLTGEIVKVSSTSITIRVNWEAPNMPKSGIKPSKNPAQMQAEMARIANSKPVEHHKEYTMDFAVGAQARVQKLPPKLDPSGKAVAYTPAEKQQLKGNVSIPGWKADLSELKVGQTVEAHIVKLPPSAADKDKPEEMFVRWAYIQSEPGDKKDDAANKKN